MNCDTDEHRHKLFLCNQNQIWKCFNKTVGPRDGRIRSYKQNYQRKAFALKIDLGEGSPGFYYSQLWNKLGFGHSTYCLSLFLRFVLMREWDARLSLEDAGRRKSNWVFLLSMFVLVKSCLNEEQGLEGGKKSQRGIRRVCVEEGPFSLVTTAKSLTDKDCKFLSSFGGTRCLQGLSLCRKPQKAPKPGRV